MKKINMTAVDFLRSASVVDSSVFPNGKIIDWIKRKNSEIYTDIKQIPISSMKGWYVDAESGDVRHESGKFFSIEGIGVSTNWGGVPEWEQPIINQPEIGFLGILAKKINGVLHFLMQAKIEPGNINIVQVSPTLQATKSNYTQVHKGKRPRYLEYFNGEIKVKKLLDQLQSEQGARFLKKRNRNIIVEIDESVQVDLTDDFVWMTIGQIKWLLGYDNVVNMDTRTVVSGIQYGAYDEDALNLHLALKGGSESSLMLRSGLLRSGAVNSFEEIISWITELKSKYELNVRKVNLSSVRGWLSDGAEIKHEKGKYFSVIGVGVQIGNREVLSWDQPMIKPAQEGLIAFIVKEIEGVYHFLVQGKLEAGNFDIVELAPTVQCLTGNYRIGQNEYSVEYISEVLNAKPEQIIYSAYQSEEGGRFFKEQNRNMIVKVGDEFPEAVAPNYCWMTLNQILKLIEFNNYMNIAARSLVAAIKLA